jgi:hypothetical protein
MQATIHMPTDQELLKYNLPIKKETIEIQVKKKKCYPAKRRYIKSTRQRFNEYIERAGKRGLQFELTYNNFECLVSEPCVYCGSIHNIGVDRKDCLIGYTIENSCSCCYKCNMMKYTHSKYEFLEHIKKIFAHLKL